MSRDVEAEFAIALFLEQINYLDRKANAGLERLKTAGWLNRRLLLSLAEVMNLWCYAQHVASRSPEGMFSRWLAKPSVMSKKIVEAHKWGASEHAKNHEELHPREGIAPIHSLNRHRKRG